MSIRRFRGLIAVAVVATGPAALAGPPVLLAADAGTAQLLRLDPLTAAPTLIGPLGVSTVAALAWDSHRGVLYATSTATNQLLRIDPLTAATTVIGSLGTGCCMHGIEYRPADATLYGVKIGTPHTLYRINPNTGSATLVASIPVSSAVGGTLAWDAAAGVMYFSDALGQTLHRINLTTGALTLVGAFGIPGTPFVQVGVGMSWDPAFGLYATDNGASGGPNDPLYRINTTTGQATLVGLTGGSNLLGLAFIGDACYADCNADGALSVADFGCFQGRYVLANAYADCNADGGLTVADFGCFQGKYVLGCP
ncbi:MAG: DUF4394 domain-containing protein [Phycisphaerales bacterium]